MQIIYEQAQPEKMKERMAAYKKMMEQPGKEKEDGKRKNDVVQ